MGGANPENIIYTARLEFDGNIDTDRLILENPYFIMKDALIKDKKTYIPTSWE